MRRFILFILFVFFFSVFGAFSRFAVTAIAQDSHEFTHVSVAISVPFTVSYKTDSIPATLVQRTLTFANEMPINKAILGVGYMQWPSSSVFTGGFFSQILSDEMPEGFLDTALHPLTVSGGVDWQNRIMDSLTLDGSFYPKLGYTEFLTVRAQKLDYTNTDTTHRFTLSKQSIVAGNLSVSMETFVSQEDKPGFIADSLVSLDTNAVKMEIIFSKKSGLLHVASQKSVAKALQIHTDPLARATTMYFPARTQEQSLVIYNTLGVVMQELRIAAGATHYTIPSHALPTGHYTARLGNHSRSFTVWR